MGDPHKWFYLFELHDAEHSQMLLIYNWLRPALVISGKGGKKVMNIFQVIASFTLKHLYNSCGHYCPLESIMFTYIPLPITYSIYNVM